MRTRVYVSGPLTSSGVPTENVQRAVDIGRELIAMGYAPLIPQLTYHVDPDAEIEHAVWMDVDLPWVGVADVVLRLAGASRGADIECAEALRLGIPVVYERGNAQWTDALRAAAPPSWHPSSVEFSQRARGLVLLHQRKAADYGSEDDPLANLRASESLGVAAWRGAWLRLKDKIFRMDAYFTRGRLKNEGVRDTLDDLASYSILTGILHDGEAQ